MFPVLNWFLGDLVVNWGSTHIFQDLILPSCDNSFSCEEMTPCEFQYEGQIFIFKYKMISYLLKVFGFPLVSARLV